MENILEIRNLRVTFHTDNGVVRALNGVDLKLRDGETLGLVGETGAGKTTLAKSVMRLISPPQGRIDAGEILFGEVDILKASQADMLSIRGNKISMIFQDPMSALNPVITVGEQIAEVIREHESLPSKEAWDKALKMLSTVGITADRAGDYPHQFSGGMKQRVVIAIALACNPTVLIADEPTTALDVTIQAQVLEMMAELKKKTDTATIIITHDLGIVAQMCESVVVLYAGEVVESGPVRDVFKKTAHPYTIGLLGAIPKIHLDEHRLHPIHGLMPDPMAPPEGCSFHERCDFADESCALNHPELRIIGDSHSVRCPKAVSR
ncbi:dipeptide/oligopeptide/nickel ABC transporter ATP-binding protein [Synergistales bacterium]|nr:dipeptide/oligopeptide/nickel ABC transporter ATP-binding protein [Synergistales bacterium]